MQILLFRGLNIPNVWPCTGYAHSANDLFPCTSDRQVLLTFVYWIIMYLGVGIFGLILFCHFLSTLDLDICFPSSYYESLLTLFLQLSFLCIFSLFSSLDLHNVNICLTFSLRFFKLLPLFFFLILWKNSNSLPLSSLTLFFHFF